MYLGIVISLSVVFTYILKNLHIEVYLNRFLLASHWLERIEEIPRPKINMFVWRILSLSDTSHFENGCQVSKSTDFITSAVYTSMKCIDFIFNWIKTRFTICYLLTCSWWKTKQLFYFFRWQVFLHTPKPVKLHKGFMSLFTAWSNELP